MDLQALFLLEATPFYQGSGGDRGGLPTPPSASPENSPQVVKTPSREPAELPLSTPSALKQVRETRALT